MTERSGVGFFGKLPGVGDFVQRRLSTAFVATWDSHFEIAVEAARGTLGDAWQATWRTAPVWRFALAPGVCGANAWVGVTGPTVDRVGRAFPMVLASAVAAATTLERLVAGGGGWFDALERMCRGAHADPGMTVEPFDAALAELPSPLDWLDGMQTARHARIDWTQADAWRMPWQPAGEDHRLAAQWSACADIENGCLWWTHGSGRVPPTILLTRGLPRAEAYVAFLDVSQGGAQWHSQGNFEATWGGLASASSPAASMDRPLDDVLADLLTPAVPASGTMPQAPDPVNATGAATGVAPGVSDVEVAACHAEGRITSVVADNGPDDPRRHAAVQMAGVLADPAACADMCRLREQLMALHAPLHQRREDLVDPVAEDGAAVVARRDEGRTTLLRIGAATAWHWRRGRLRPLFVQAAASPPDQADTVRPGDLAGMLSDTPPRPAPGLGAAAQPRCEEITCLVEPGDRLLLLATEPLARLPVEAIADALAADGDVCTHIAAAAGLGTDRTRWPLAVIEVEA